MSACIWDVSEKFLREASLDSIKQLLRDYQAYIHEYKLGKFPSDKFHQDKFVGMERSFNEVSAFLIGYERAKKEQS